MKLLRYSVIILSSLFLFCASAASASSFLILEVQTTGAGGAYDEFVKIQNNTGQTINLSGYKLQSQGSSGGNWINRTGTGGLSDLTVGPNQVFVIASKESSGSGEVYRHTARWGLSDAAGGVKFLDADGNVLAEEHWSESSGLVVFHQPVADAPPVVENPPTENPPVVEPVEPADSVVADDADVAVVPETQTPTVTPSETEGSHTTQEADEISPLPPPAAAVGRNDDGGAVKTAKAGEESVVKSPSSPPPLLKGEDGWGISEIKKLENDSKVKVRGVVSVAPGVLGSQIFYLSGSGIQVYMFKKDFPDLKIGDTVDIEGTLSEAYGEKRIKLASRDSIKSVSSGQAPAPREIAANEIGESMEGSLVKIGGEIIEVKKDSWYLADGEKEIKVLLKEGANIPSDLVKAGDKVEITGIVSQYNKEYRLLPRSIDDINILQPAGATNSAAETPQNQESKGFGIKDYLFVGIPSLLLVGFLVVRRKISKTKNQNLDSRVHRQGGVSKPENDNEEVV